MIGSLQHFIVALGGAIGVFCLGKLLIAGGHHTFEPALDWIRPKLGRIDHFLAVTVSRWIGLDERRNHRRWSQFLGILLALGLMGALAPWPLGVAALSLGMMAVLAVFRRWAWDEEDRAMGLRAEDRRIPGGEDYSDEALAALAAVFMLCSLLVWRLTGAQAFEGPAIEGTPGYLLHILSETLSAFPIVGNVDLLGYEDPSGVRVVQPNGGPVAFVLRMAIDLVVIGGLLKALDISRRIARGQDLRREEEALASRELASVLPSIGRLRRLAMGGDANAMKLLSTAAANPAAGQAPRARLCAIHALRGVAAQHPEWASGILADNRAACAALLAESATAEAGLLGATHVEDGENALAEVRFSMDHIAAKLIGRAISGLGQALLAPGLSPLPEAFLLDKPGPASPLVRASIVLRMSKLLVTLAERSHADSTAEILSDALRHVELVFQHMPADAPVDVRFDAHQCHAEILARLGQLDEGYEGSLKLTDALDAFASANALLGPDDAHQRVRVGVGCGVAHEILGHRTDGEAALAHFERAAQLFDSAAALLIAIEADASERARCFLNLGNSSRAAAGVAGDSGQKIAWLDQAVAAYSAALQSVGAGHWPSLTVDALEGLASAHESRFHLNGEKEALTTAMGMRLTLLDEIDPRQAPVDWALAAIELSQTEHWALRFAESTMMGTTAISRLRQARDILENAGAVDEARRCEDLMKQIDIDIAARGRE